MNRAAFLLCFLAAVSYTVSGAETLDLSQAIKLGLENNMDLEFAHMENSIAFKNMRMRYREYLPSVNVGYSAYDSVTYCADDTHSRKISAGIKQKIYDKGVLRSSIKIEKERLELEAVQNRMDRNSYIFSVIDKYKNVLELEKELDITRQARNVVAKQVEIGHMELDIGEITQSDYLELELALSDMEIQVSQISQKLSQSHLDFASMMNMRPEDLPALTGKINYLYSGSISEDESFFAEQALSNSLELKELEYSAHRSDAEYKILKRKYLPTVYVTCNAAIADNYFPISEKSFSVELTLDFDTPGIPGSVSMGIGKNSSDQRFRSFSAEADILGNSNMLYSEARGKIAYRRARWNRDKYARECRSKVAELYKNIQVLVKNLESSRKKIELEERKVGIEELKVQLGEEKRIDYVESQIELAQNRIQVFRAISDLYSQEVELMKLCGLSEAAYSGKKLIQGSGL